MFVRLGRWAAFVALFSVIAYRIDVRRLSLYVAICAAVTLSALLAVDPDLLRERVHNRTPTSDPIQLLTLRVLTVVHLTIALADLSYFHWSDDVPASVWVPGLIVFGAAASLMVRAMVVNPFFSTALRLQADRGHRLITDGPYRFVRHPGYLALLVAAPASALALGSWVSLIPAIVYAAFIIRRAAIEDAFVRQRLPGYQEYSRRVAFRLIPGIW